MLSVQLLPRNGAVQLLDGLLRGFDQGGADWKKNAHTVSLCWRVTRQNLFPGAQFSEGSACRAVVREVEVTRKILLCTSGIRPDEFGAKLINNRVPV
jgi:hypothetical protein